MHGLDISHTKKLNSVVYPVNHCNDFHFLFYRFVSGFILQGKDPVKEYENNKEPAALWGIEKLQAYFSIVKTLQPVFTEEATFVLRHYYQVQRQTDRRNAARTTIRLLESLVRYM